MNTLLRAYYLKHKIYFLIRIHHFILTDATKKRIHSYQYEQTTTVAYVDSEIKIYSPAKCEGLWYVLSILPGGASGEELTRKLFWPSSLPKD